MANKNKNHHLVKRGDVWYFVSMVKGQRICRPLSDSVMEARKLRDEILERLRTGGELFPPAENEQKQIVLFGELAQRWADVTEHEVKYSSMRDYKSAMNKHILPHFGNTPIAEITYLDVVEFRAQLGCGPKRANNILVPMRAVFKLAMKLGLLERNIMTEVDNLRVDEARIHPLAYQEVLRFLDFVDTAYYNFFAVAFFTGMRFGEMAGLKWDNVDFDRRLLRVVETRVYGREGRPKTKRSVRDVTLVAPALEALTRQRELTPKDDVYVFRDREGNLLTPDHVRKLIWTPALERAQIPYRPLIQTRHTFATMMIDAGEDLGWVQNMLGHGSLQMIYTRYYSWIKKSTRQDGNAFMRNMYDSEKDFVPAIPLV